MYQQILTAQQTGGKAVFGLGGNMYLCIEENRYTYFNIGVLDVPGFVPGATPQTHASYILMAICGGLL